MTLFEIFILAIIQAFTEFLPVSSSGHLAIVQTLFERSKGITSEYATLDVILHFGTLLSTVVFFRSEIVDLVRGSFSRERRQSSLFKGNEKHVIALILVSLIPTGVIGLTLNPWFEWMLHNLILVAFMLCITAIVLFASRYFIPFKELYTASILDALIIGIVQGVAVFPGLSRSGTTISMALMLGWNREDAFKFSFLASIPAILGATIWKASHLNFLDFHALGGYLFGMIVAGSLGYVMLVILRRAIIGKKFFLFGFYCVALAIFTIALAVMKG